jgi:hypothetical protein
MPQCETCGNNYDKSFQVIMDGLRYEFDSFECAIQKLAPTCGHCGCRIIGHGVEGANAIFCCANCARQENVRGVQDRESESLPVAV